MLSVSENTVAGCARGEKASGVLGAAEEEVRALLRLSWDLCWKPPSLPAGSPLLSPQISSRLLRLESARAFGCGFSLQLGSKAEGRGLESCCLTIFKLMVFEGKKKSMSIFVFT